MGLFSRAPDVETLKAEGDVPGLIEALSYNKNSAIQCGAAKALGEVGGVDAVKALVRTFGWTGWVHKLDHQFTREAMAAVARLREPYVLEILVANMRDNDNAFRRKRAAETLIQIGDARAVPMLIEFARSTSDPGLQFEAVETLGKLHDLSAADALVDFLNYESRVPAAALQALDEIGWVPGNDETTATYFIIKEEWNKCVAIGAPAAKPLLAATNRGKQTTRAAAIEALVAIGAPAMPALLDARANAEKAAFITLIEEILARIGGGYDLVAKHDWDGCVAAGVASIQPLLGALADPDNEVREAAGRALGRIDDPRAVGVLIKALKDSNAGVRRVATSALAEVDDPRAAAALKRTKKAEASKASGKSHRRSGRMSERKSIPELVKLFMGSDMQKIPWAGSQLASYGDEAIGPLLKALGDKEMLARYKMTAPLSHDEAGQLILGLAARRMQYLT